MVHPLEKRESVLVVLVVASRLRGGKDTRGMVHRLEKRESVLDGRQLPLIDRGRDKRVVRTCMIWTSCEDRRLLCRTP